jgi:uncharacterized membrane protein YdfJ with MMPL/SSD domain
MLIKLFRDGKLGEEDLRDHLLMKDKHVYDAWVRAVSKIVSIIIMVVSVGMLVIGIVLGSVVTNIARAAELYETPGSIQERFGIDNDASAIFGNGAQRPSLDYIMEDKRMMLEQQRIQLERERLELDRQRLELERAKR